MASIVTYGADQIFSSEKGTYTVAIDTNKNHRIGWRYREDFRGWWRAYQAWSREDEREYDISVIITNGW